MCQLSFSDEKLPQEKSPKMRHSENYVFQIQKYGKSNGMETRLCLDQISTCDMRGLHPLWGHFGGHQWHLRLTNVQYLQLLHDETGQRRPK